MLEHYNENDYTRRTMTEKMKSPELPKDNLRTPEVIGAEKLEAFLAKTAQDAEEIAGMRFSTEEKALLGARAFGSRIVDTLNTIEGASTLDITFYSPGVHVPQFSIQKVADSDNDRRGLFVSVDDAKPMSEIDPFQEITGTIYSMNNQISEREDGSFQAKPSLIVTQSIAAKDEINLTVGGEYPFIDVTARPRALIELNGHTRFTVDELEIYKRKLENRTYEDAFERSSVKKPIAKYFGKLSGALYAEKKGELVQLKKTEIIHKIGMLGASFARKGEDEAEIISRVILGRLGFQRQLLIEHEVTSDDTIAKQTVHGHLMEVIMPSSESDETEPVLVIDSSNVNESDPGVHFIPFDRVKSLRF